MNVAKFYNQNTYMYIYNIYIGYIYFFSVPSAFLKEFERIVCQTLSVSPRQLAVTLSSPTRRFLCSISQRVLGADLIIYSI